MSDSASAILLILGIVTVLALAELLILVIPLRISLSFHSHGMETRGIIAVSWLIFGLEVLVPGRDPQVSVMVGRARLITRSMSAQATPIEQPSGMPGPGRVPGIISSLLALQGPILGAVLDLIRHTRFDEARGTLRIGLDDPSATGVLYGLYWAVRPLLPSDRINVMMVPEFNREVCEVDITTRFRITYPFRIMVNAVRIMKHPAARKAMMGMRQKPGEVAA